MDVTKGLQYLHDHDFVHGDLKGVKNHGSEFEWSRTKLTFARPTSLLIQNIALVWLTLGSQGSLKTRVPGTHGMVEGQERFDGAHQNACSLKVLDLGRNLGGGYHQRARISMR